jgi:GTP cyclohydrolase I
VSLGPDREALERAFAAVVAALGLPDGTPEMDGTARRAAAAWADEFADGYARSARDALGELSPAPADVGTVVVTGLDFTSVCPHHLLPYRGTAHLAYRPASRVPGFGRLSTLVDTLAHRLVLQETLAADLARALVEVLDAPGAAVVLEAEQTCLSMRGENQRRARTFVEAAAGASAADVRTALLAALPRRTS